MGMARGGGGTDSPRGAAVNVTLELRPERRLIRPGGSHRHVDCQIKVDGAPSGGERMALSLALVLDRSGSMAGEKLAVAKRAALAVLERLDERDRAAVVVFDDRIEVVQRAAPVTEAVKAAVRSALARIEARGSTALHEGWLTGCHTIAGDAPPGQQGVARCFLLTDGLANVGISDPETITTEAAGIREHAGIGTSTFGIGADYNEALLGPMAQAAGGQFHHLCAAAEIADTFVGELGELLAIAARQVRLEHELAPRVTADLVSAYWAGAVPDGRLWSIAIGDLLGGEERHVVVRLGFPPRNGQAGQTVRARLVWLAGGEERRGEWQEITFHYADDRACDAEPRDAAVMHWVGLHHAERAQREAAERSKRGDLRGAREALRGVARHIAQYAGADQDLAVAQQELRVLEQEVAAQSVAPLRAKEIWSEAQRRSRGQRDFRQTGAEANQSPRDAAAEVVRRYLPYRVAWPDALPAQPPADALRDRYRGCLLWGAVGDALGRAAEGQEPAALRARYGPAGLQHYVPWHGWQGGPRGTITDDTQLTMEVARTLLAAPERFDGEDFARRLVAWLPSGRGKGQATTEAVEALARGEPWWQAGLAVNSAGNGAAMRAAPVGLAQALRPTPWKLRRDAVLAAFPTHTHPVGIGGAVAIAAGVAYGVRAALNNPGRLEPRAYLDFVAGTIEGTEPAQSRERRPGGGAVRLSERIREVADLLGWSDPGEVFQYIWNGAFALESVPAALYCFLRTPDEPRQVILTAVNAGHDADTVASMAGNLAGAWCGAERLRREGPEWWADLEYRDELIELADRLVELALRKEVDDGTEE